MNYKINPVKATCKGKTYDEQGIQELNDTCFGICASYSDTVDTYGMDPNCTKACVDLIEQRKLKQFGVGSCDHQVPYRPVIWEQFGRYFPKLLKQGLNPKDALFSCKRLCKEKSPLVAEECQEACMLDYNALDNIDELNGSNRMQERYSGGNLSNEDCNNLSLCSALVFLLSIICVISFMYFLKKK